MADGMKLSYERVGTSIDLEQLVEKARVAERSRDLEGLKALLEPIWDDFTKKPDFEDLEPGIRADLLWICGYFITHYGQAHNVENFAGVARDLLTSAIEAYEELDLPHEVGRAKTSLAAVYFHEGLMEEMRIILDDAASYYENDQLHPVNLMIAVTKVGGLVWENDYQNAVSILNDVKIPMELCEDRFLLVRYHGQAGIIYSRIGRFEEAISHFERAENYSNELNNLNYVANISNSCALGYLRMGALEAAEKKIEQSIGILNDVTDTSMLAHSLDTKAQIHLASEEFEKALNCIDESIELFEQGVKYSGLADALWVKLHILLRTNRKKDAFMLFWKLTEMVSGNIGEYAVKKYAEKFAELIHVKRGTDFFGEVQAFKRDLLMESLIENDADIDKAAKKLKASRHQIIRVLNREFPDIYLELGISPHVMTTANN